MANDSLRDPTWTQVEGQLRIDRGTEDDGLCGGPGQELADGETGSFADRNSLDHVRSILAVQEVDRRRVGVAQSSSVHDREVCDRQTGRRHLSPQHRAAVEDDRIGRGHVAPHFHRELEADVAALLGEKPQSSRGCRRQDGCPSVIGRMHGPLPSLADSPGPAHLGPDERISFPVGHRDGEPEPVLRHENQLNVFGRIRRCVQNHRGYERGALESELQRIAGRRGAGSRTEGSVGSDLRDTEPCASAAHDRTHLDTTVRQLE